MRRILKVLTGERFLHFYLGIVLLVLGLLVSAVLSTAGAVPEASPGKAVGFSEPVAVSASEATEPVAVCTLPALVAAETPAESAAEAQEINEGELWWLAHLLAGECQAYSWEHQIAVGSVVLNRVKHPGYPDSIPEVITEKRQYACYWDGNFQREPTERNWEVARHLLQNGSQIPEGVIFQSQRKQGPLWQKIDNHYFCFGR